MLYRLSRDDHSIYVYDRNSMSDVKDVIPLQDTNPTQMSACNVANSLYVCLRSKSCHRRSVFRIARDAEQKFTISPQIKDHRPCISKMSVTANGSLIIRSAQTGCPDVGLHVVSKYNANGSLEQDIKLSPDTNALIFTNAIQKPNGNLVLACVSNEYEHKELGLLEIDRHWWWRCTPISIINAYLELREFCRRSWQNYDNRPVQRNRASGFGIDPPGYTQSAGEWTPICTQ